MEPKFQSSFIPKDPITSTAPGVMMGSKTKGTGLLAFLALVIFFMSVFLAAGVFGYKLYLKYSINRMGNALEVTRATLQPDVIRELTRLDHRIRVSQALIGTHQVLSPLFEFLEASTPRTVRFNDFGYSTSERDIELTLRGEAQGYAALAFAADIFSKSQYLKNFIFSDLTLNEKGNVKFSFKAIVDPSVVSYQREVELMGAVPVTPIDHVAATGTATSTQP